MIQNSAQTPSSPNTLPDPWVAEIPHLVTHDWPLLVGALVLLLIVRGWLGRSPLRREMRRGFKRMARRQDGGAGLGSYTWRYLSGHHMDGVHRTDASAFRRGRSVLDQTNAGRQLGKWSYLSRAERAAWRLGAVGVLAIGIYGYATEPALTVDVFDVSLIGGISYSAYRAYQSMRARQHYRHVIRPLHKALCASPYLLVTQATHPDTYLTVPVDYATNEDASVVMRLPEGFAGDGSVKGELVRIIKDKLGMGDTVVKWRIAGSDPCVTLNLAPRPPKRITWNEALARIEAAPESAPLIGFGTRNAPVSVDVDTESPHILVSAGSGAGKSVITRVIVSQFMHNGAHTIFLDVKRHSHRWARGLPNVTYCRSIEEIHDALIWAAAEGERRNILVDDFGDDATKKLPRLVIVAEEMNATINRLQKYWAEVRTKDDPKSSPAVTALGDILFMGRAVRETVVAIAQLMTARTLGGPEARENFPVRILARYSRNAWNMLVPEIQPMPKSSRHPGRVQVCIAGVATETQVIFPSEDETRAWASSGVSMDAAGGTVLPSQSTIYQGNEGSSVVGQRPALTLVPELAPPPELAGVSLSQAVNDGVLKVTLTVARKASNRDAEFPRPIGKDGSANLYDPADLMAWERNRVRAVS